MAYVRLCLGHEAAIAYVVVLFEEFEVLARIPLLGLESELLVGGLDDVALFKIESLLFVGHVCLGYLGQLIAWGFSLVLHGIVDSFNLMSI